MLCHVTLFTDQNIHFRYLSILHQPLGYPVSVTLYLFNQNYFSEKGHGILRRESITSNRKLIPFIRWLSTRLGTQYTISVWSQFRLDNDGNNATITTWITFSDHAKIRQVSSFRSYLLTSTASRQITAWIQHLGTLKIKAQAASHIDESNNQ